METSMRNMVVFMIILWISVRVKKIMIVCELNDYYSYGVALNWQYNRMMEAGVILHIVYEQVAISYASIKKCNLFSSI